MKRAQVGTPSGRQSLRRWFKSTSNRTFIVYPLLVFAFEFALQGGIPGQKRPLDFAVPS